MENRKILYLPTTNAGVNYWRHWNFANAIFRTGVGQALVMWYDRTQVDLAPWEFNIQQAYDNDDWLLWNAVSSNICAEIRKTDAIVFGMLHCPAALGLFEDAIEHRNKGNFGNTAILMEIDDNILSVPVQNAAFGAYAPGSEIRRITERQMRIADGLIVSTPYLKQVYREYNNNIHVIPNSIDFKLWENLKNKPKPGVRIGWSGGSAHREDLEIIQDVMPKILEAHPEVRFVIFHGYAGFMEDLREKYPGRIELHKEWARIDKYPAKMASLDVDIWLAPLIDSAFNRGKSNLRWLEAAALGAPCVASNVGHFAETIENGVDGMLCDTEEEWFHALSTLISNRRRRQGMGLRAKQKAFDKFNVDTVAGQYVKAVDECINIISDRAVIAAQKALEAREKQDEHDESAVEDPCLIDGRGPAAESVC